MDMKLIDIKDTLPVGFIPIQETVDTRKSSARDGAQKYLKTVQRCWNPVILKAISLVVSLVAFLLFHRGAGLQEEAALHQVYSTGLHRGSDL